MITSPIMAAFSILSISLISTDSRVDILSFDTASGTNGTAACAHCIAASADPAYQPAFPTGYFSTRGNQIVDSAGSPVRLVCAAFGAYNEVPLARHFSDMRTNGFNCSRIEWHNATMQADIAKIDRVVAAASAVGLKIILDHHLDEANSACNGYSQQKNGLWFDLGPGTDGTDGCVPGTVTAQSFLSDWVAMAKRFARNSTVIGFDLHNEPLEVSTTHPRRPASVWGGGGPADIHKMYTEVGTAIQQVNPDALIIAEGPIEWHSLYVGNLTGARTLPVVLPVPHKLVYSVHLYPSNIGGEPTDFGEQYIATMNIAWGYLVTENIAPVWIGEMGASMNSRDDRAWAGTIVPYLNGKAGASGGPTFVPPNQPISTDWWCWCQQEGQRPNGLLDDNGRVRAEQLEITRQLRYVPP
jgi:endoglucanase